MVNKFPGSCGRCGGYVPAGVGLYDRATRSAVHAPSCARNFAPPALRPTRPTVKALGKMEAAFTAAGNRRNAAVTALHAAAKAKFAAAGGCTHCGGAGSVVTWSTLDGPGYTEYGACDKCHGKGPKGYPGVTASNGNGHRVFTGGPYPDARADFPDLAAAVDRETALLDRLRTRLSDLKGRLDVHKGAKARVVKGRKVPLGTAGDVVWHGAGRFGYRAGLKDAAGTVHWTAATNLHVTHYLAAPAAAPAAKAKEAA